MTRCEETAAKFPGRQTDAVNDDEIDRRARRPRIEIRRSQLPRAAHQSALEVDFHAVSICDNQQHMNPKVNGRRVCG